MDLDLSDDQIALRDGIASMLAARVPIERVRAGFDRALFDKLAEGHADWPRMTGAVGSANAWGGDDETKMKLMRVDRVQYGPLFLTNVAVAELG